MFRRNRQKPICPLSRICRDGDCLVPDGKVYSNCPQGKKNKYNAKSVIIDGIKFASKKEGRKYSELKILYKAGQILDLMRQVVFPLEHNGVLICKYIADFVMRDKAGKRHAIDAKGVRTPVYKLKKKMMKAFYGIEIEEC